MLVIFSFDGAVIMLYNNRINLDYAYKRYLVIALISSTSGIALSLLLMFTVFNQQRDVGRIVGLSVSMLILVIFLLISMFRKAKPKYSKPYWQFALKFSLPMVPHGVSQVLLGQVDRIMIQQICGNAQAGIFSLAGSVRMIPMILSDSLSNTWGVWFFVKTR